MTQISLTARWVMPVDGPPLPGAVVTIDDGTIVAVGDRRSAAGPVQDLGDVVLLPGLVNAHTHLQFSGLRRPLGQPGMELADWIRLVIADRKRSDRDLLANIAEGLRESLACGVTTLGDIATAPAAPFPHVLTFQEVIGFSTARVDSAQSELLERLDSSRDSTSRRPATRRVAARGISPHAPYTVHPRLLERLVEEAAIRKLPVAMHLAESRAELELLAAGTGPLRELLEQRSMWDAAAIPAGSTPLDYLRMLARAPRSLVIHGNYLSSAELDFVAEHRERMSIVYCPRTHEYFQHAEYRLQEMLAAGVRVALGTDSRASNPDLNLFDELRSVARKHDVPASEVIRLGTLSGAEALGWGDVVGSITPGKWADLIAVPCCEDDPTQAVLNHEGPPNHVWLRGEAIRD